jgi:copper homeostasis protein
LISETGAWEYHTSARIAVANPLTWQNDAITDYGKVWMADEKELRAILGQM